MFRSLYRRVALRSDGGAAAALSGRGKQSAHWSGNKALTGKAFTSAIDDLSAALPQGDESARPNTEKILSDIQNQKQKAESYPKLSIKDAVLSKYPFRIEFEGTVPMKMMLNQEYQYPHFKAKIRVVVADMSLPADIRRVFIELCGHRYAGGRVAFTARNYHSVEACEEKVYSLLDHTITKATQLAAEFKSVDSTDPNLAILQSAIGTELEAPRAVEARGVLPPYQRKMSVIGRRRKGLYLEPTGFSVTALGMARKPQSAVSTASTAAAATPAAAEPVPKTPEQQARTEKRRQERAKRKAYRDSIEAAKARDESKATPLVWSAERGAVVSSGAVAHA